MMFVMQATNGLGPISWAVMGTSDVRQRFDWQNLSPKTLLTSEY
jgi:hypothetical protein